VCIPRANHPAALAALKGWAQAVCNDWLPEVGEGGEGGDTGIVLPATVVQQETEEEREKREDDEARIEREQLNAIASFQPEPGWLVVEAVPVECLCPGVPNLCTQTERALKKREVAVKLVSGWERGSVHVQEKSKVNKGYFSIKVPGQRGWILYDLKRENYGVDKGWVLVVRDQPVDAMRTVAQAGLSGV